MNAITKALKNQDRNDLWESPLLWSTVAVYSIALAVFLWSDFARVIAWVAA